VTVEVVRAWRAAGVNRVSLGSQTFDERVLAWMHRTHTVAQTAAAVEIIRGEGIENFSLDLIFAVPAELGRSWERDLERSTALRPAHLSFYGLTIEPATPLARWQERGELVEADEDRYAAEFLQAHDALAAAGFEHYEVSNFALPGRRSRHNSSYWSGAPYLGLGPSAHGFDGVTRRWNVAAYVEWERRLAAGCDPAAGAEELTAENRIAEQVYLGLRTSGGLDVIGDERDRVSRWVDAGWAALDGDRLRLTPPGWLRLDAVAADLTVRRSR
jgi:oxygen-independent coproporphyrinogen-3 oxidase